MARALPLRGVATRSRSSALRLPFDDDDDVEEGEEDENADRNCEGSLRRDAMTLLEGEEEAAVVADLEGCGAALEVEVEEEALEGPALFPLFAEGMAGDKRTSGRCSGHLSRPVHSVPSRW